MSGAPIPQAKRNQILKVIFISLLLDLVCQPSVPELRELTNPDLLYLYPTVVPQAPRVLP